MLCMVSLSTVNTLFSNFETGVMLYVLLLRVSLACECKCVLFIVTMFLDDCK